MDSRGRLFVGDRENNRIQIFDQDGKFLDEWRQFGRPSGISITKDDTIYVADSESGPDTGAHELPGIKKGIRIGSAKDGTVDRVHRGHGIDDAAITPARKASASMRRATSTAESSAARCSSDTCFADDGRPQASGWSLKPASHRFSIEAACARVWRTVTTSPGFSPSSRFRYWTRR